MIYSMTGFAMQSRELDGTSIHLELRSVNSRYLDLVFRIADDLRAAEPSLREQITARVTRGKLECRLSLQAQTHHPRVFTLNTALLDRLAATESAIQVRFPHAQPFSVAELLHWPNILADDSPSFEQLQPIISELVQYALDEFLATRQREGEKLSAMIRERIANMRELIVQVTPRIPTLVEEYRARLTRRLNEVLASADEERIVQETVLYAARIDVAEELTRLAAHVDELERILDTGGAAGKRLDFLMQELNREANTLASKSPAHDVTGIAMEMKVQIEQIREQVQNIE